MSLQPVIPWRVALQQSPTPLHRPRPWLPTTRLSASQKTSNSSCAQLKLSQLRGSPQDLVSLLRFLRTFSTGNTTPATRVNSSTPLAIRTIEDSSELHPANRLGKAIPPSQGKPPFSLDGYLSWMSRKGPVHLPVTGFLWHLLVQRCRARLRGNADVQG
jgi:hypothetical protein